MKMIENGENLSMDCCRCSIANIENTEKKTGGSFAKFGCITPEVDEKGPIGPMAETWDLKALPTNLWDEHQGGREGRRS